MPPEPVCASFPLRLAALRLRPRFLAASPPRPNRQAYGAPADRHGSHHHGEGPERIVRIAQRTSLTWRRGLAMELKQQSLRSGVPNGDLDVARGALAPR